ncbi:unnamed protein product [Brassica rapa subsp. trilocularis]
MDGSRDMKVIKEEDYNCNTGLERVKEWSIGSGRITD